MPKFKTTLLIYNIFNIFILLSSVLFIKFIGNDIIILLLGIDISLCGILGLYYKRVLFTKTPPLEYKTSIVARSFNIFLIVIGILIIFFETAYLIFG